jgi:glycosyltransferase involved in cell wall biosynthesis
VLDLAGDQNRAVAWARERIEGKSIELLGKAQLKWKSKVGALSYVRSLHPETFAIYTPDLRIQSGRRLMILFACLAGARTIRIGDGLGNEVVRSRIAAVAIEPPSLALEMAFGYLLLVPLSWLFVWVLGAATFIRRHGPPLGMPNRRDSDRPMHALYLRATLVPDGVTWGGGLAAHVAGFVNAATDLGHRLTLISSGAADISKPGVATFGSEPSPLISATRSLLELHNNLVFTINVLRRERELLDSVDFIYQRYSRFNFSGVVLSLITGLPLMLEFNGSEVWVSKHWDPVGQIRLLRQFENINLRASDVVFVVSEAQRRDLESSTLNVPVIVNPNGANPDLFQSGCGRSEVRRRLGLSDETVVGFLGTFGPWHGARILAEAAVKLARVPGLHFLFVGDGEQRVSTEEALSNSTDGARATFVGRVARSEVPSYLDACDILVSPQTALPDGSEFFGSPTKLFEYMSMAKPVIASRLGQIAEVVVDGESGLLVSPGNPTELASAIERLAGDPSLRSKLGRRARERVELMFTWRQNAQRVFDAARKCVLEA